MSTMVSSTQDRWSVPPSMSKAMLQTGEAFTVEGYKNKHAGTHEAIISDDVLMLLRERERGNGREE